MPILLHEHMHACSHTYTHAYTYRKGTYLSFNIVFVRVTITMMKQND